MNNKASMHRPICLVMRWALHKNHCKNVRFDRSVFKCTCLIATLYYNIIFFEWKKKKERDRNKGGEWQGKITSKRRESIVLVVRNICIKEMVFVFLVCQCNILFLLFFFPFKLILNIFNIRFIFKIRHKFNILTSNDY